MLQQHIHVWDHWPCASASLNLILWFSLRSHLHIYITQSSELDIYSYSNATTALNSQEKESNIFSELYSSDCAVSNLEYICLRLCIFANQSFVHFSLFLVWNMAQRLIPCFSLHISLNPVCMHVCLYYIHPVKIKKSKIRIHDYLVMSYGKNINTKTWFMIRTLTL